MLYGKVLRPPTYGAKLTAVDLAPAMAMPGVAAVRDGSFVGVAAPTTFLAERALQAVAATAQWEPAPQPSSKEIFEYLKQHAESSDAKNPFQTNWRKPQKPCGKPTTWPTSSTLPWSRAGAWPNGPTAS